MLPFLQVLKSSKPLQLCFGITFFASGLIINFVQCVLYLSLKPWNKRLYRKINYYLCNGIFAQFVFLGDWWAGIDIRIFADKDDFDKYCGKEHAYCIINHTYEIDWLIIMLMSDRARILGNSKAYVKKSLQYLPLLGWAWKFSDFVMLERSFEKDKKVIPKQITELADYPDPMWLAFFPEGTRFTPDKHKVSEDFARQRNLPKLKHHLQPRTRGFIASLPSMKGKVPAIYDVVLAFKEDDPVKPTLINLIMGKTMTAHIYMNRIPMEDLPDSEVEQEKFLRDMFVRKDKMRDSFVQTGDFFSTSGVPRVTPLRANRRIYTFINAVAWAIVILCPMIYYLLLLLFSGQLLYVMFGVSVIIFFMGLLYMMVGTSKASKGSSYGATNTSKSTS